MHSINASVAALIALACIPTITYADVVISSVHSNDTPTRVLIASDMARIDTGDSIYLLINLRSSKMYAIDDAGRYAMDMSSPIPTRQEHGELNTSAVPLPTVRFEPRGKGPQIAGFATEHYRVSVNGQHCFDEFLAPTALKQAPIQRFIETMSAASHNDEKRALMQLTEPTRICEAAADIIDDYYPRLGIPLRTQDTLGRVIHNITAIDLNAPHDAAALRMPEGYEMLTRAELAARATPTVDAAVAADAVDARRQKIEQHMREFGDAPAAQNTSAH
ncbi:MAG: hypothetical protein LBV36_00865 [Chromatiales bacterium]|jgi:hypothetical protein|nr:hypothetical protein [Chromatiales bacterium]